ncbi:nuclear protein MDM1-like [Oncorhynchus masou masou]|uniref:nuclear protein MDM1-like n=1 Tax=Oncorhynchus masou masou TaxID=90313 RepID=UPI0031845194
MTSLRGRLSPQAVEQRCCFVKQPVDGSRVFEFESTMTVTVYFLHGFLQMLYTSHRSIPPFKSNPVVVVESEYSRNFKASPPPRGPRLRSHVDGDQVPLFQRENVSPEKASKSKRKKKREERESSIVEENIPLPQPREQLADQEVKSQSSQKAHLPHRKVKSEYNANFRSPLNYIYKDGAWVKASTLGEERGLIPEISA